MARLPSISFLIGSRGVLLVALLLAAHTVAAFDPWLCCAKCMSSWNCVQYQMASMIIWAFVVLILSGILSQNDGGSFQNISYTVGNTTTSFKNFAVDVCAASPYIYIRPFSFSYTPGGTAITFCGFPFGTTLLRLIISIVAFLILISLFFYSPLSYFGKYIFLTFAFLYFAAFVLDCNSVSTGSLLCSENFLNTGMNTAISKLGLTLSCDSNKYITICIIDVVMSIQFFFLSTSWSLCTDKYPKRETSDQKTLSKMAVGEKETKRETKKKDKKKAKKVDLDDDDLI